MTIMFDDRYDIQMTREDIRNGCALEAESCAIALAIVRCVPGCTNVNVDTAASVFVGSEKDACEYEVIHPHQYMVDYFINAFDVRKPVDPISFTIQKQVEAL